MEQFKKYRKASQKWSNDSKYKMRAFDRYCYELYPGETGLTQEMVNLYFQKKDTENFNSCISRCSIICEFIKYLQLRELTTVTIPDRPRTQKQKYIPHAFTAEELSNFFNACDNLRYLPHRQDMKMRSIMAPIIFRLLYSTGMRTAETLSLKCEEVNLTNGVISIVNSKGYKDHYIVLHDSMLELMKKFNSSF